jgi:hypothetical protein
MLKVFERLVRTKSTLTGPHAVTRLDVCTPATSKRAVWLYTEEGSRSHSRITTGSVIFGVHEYIVSSDKASAAAAKERRAAAAAAEVEAVSATAHKPAAAKKKKVKLTFTGALKFLATQPQIRCLATMAICQVRHLSYKAGFAPCQRGLPNPALSLVVG